MTHTSLLQEFIVKMDTNNLYIQGKGNSAVDKGPGVWSWKHNSWIELVILHVIPCDTLLSAFVVITFLVAVACGQLCTAWSLSGASGSARGWHFWAWLNPIVVPVSGGGVEGGDG